MQHRYFQAFNYPAEYTATSIEDTTSNTLIPCPIVRSTSKSAARMLQHQLAADRSLPSYNRCMVSINVKEAPATQAPSFDLIAQATFATVTAYAFAGLFTLPEAYWAAITAIIVMRSTVESTLSISARRLVGTALGAIAGAFIYQALGRNAISFGLGLFFVGIVSTFAGRNTSSLQNLFDYTTFRFAAVAYAVVVLIPRKQPIWTTAIHRFLEVSIGILVALAVARFWPRWNRDGAAA